MSSLELFVVDTNWKEIEEKLDNGIFSNEDYSDLIDNTLSKMKKFLELFKEKVIQKYPDENYRPKELQSRIEKIDSIIKEN